MDHKTIGGSDEDLGLIPDRALSKLHTSAGISVTYPGNDDGW